MEVGGGGRGWVIFRHKLVFRKIHLNNLQLDTLVQMGPANEIARVCISALTNRKSVGVLQGKAVVFSFLRRKFFRHATVMHNIHCVACSSATNKTTGCLFASHAKYDRWVRLISINSKSVKIFVRPHQWRAEERNRS